MKKLIWVLTLLTVATGLRAQYAYQYEMNYLEYNNSGQYDKQKIVDNRIKEMTETNTRNKKTTSKKYEFDSSGILKKFTICYGSIGKLRRQHIYTYTLYKQTPDYTLLNGKGKELRKKVFTYNSDSLLIEEVEYKKGELFSKVLYKYDSTRITESEYYWKKMDQPKDKWVYEYYPNHSKKSSTLYTNGKVKYVWNYECKEEGELIKKHKDTTIVCENTEFDKDGNKTVTSRNFNDRGKPYKSVSVYNKDKKLIESRNYDHKDLLYYRSVQSPENSSYVWYSYRHGVERFRVENLYNSKNKKSEEVHYKNQNIVTLKRLYSYNEKDLLVSVISTGKKGRQLYNSKYTYGERDLLLSENSISDISRLHYECKYTYDEHDLLLSKTKISGKGKLVGETRLSYLFY